MESPSITKYRPVYKPFEYPKAFDFYEKQVLARWHHSEVSMAKDINDWKMNLTESERQIVGQILKSFTQTELFVNEYWSQNVCRWFPKHEIRLMASEFAAVESIHIQAYAYLNDSLGLTDYSAFLSDPTAVAKLERLQNTKGGKNKADIARSLAIFSGFTEGVNLFSSFAVLMSLSRFNLLKGVENIVSWSVLDESTHSEAGCWLFRQLVEENPEIFNDELKRDIYEAARISVQLEDDFIDNVFSLGEIRGLTKDQLKNFIRNRANIKLQELGLKQNWKNIDKEMLKETNWFYEMTQGVEFRDFFAGRVTEYQKCDFNEENLFER